MAWSQQSTPVWGTPTLYWLFTPDNPPPGKLPLLVHLAGLGEVSNTGSQQDFQTLWNNTPQELKDGVAANNFYCIIPLLNQSLNDGSGPNGAGYGLGWRPTYTDFFVNQGLAINNVDPFRIYISGLSLGGGGAAWYADSANPIHPGKIAACVDICGVCLPTTLNGVVVTDYSQPGKNNIAVAAFHAADDPTVAPGCSQGLVLSINSFNPKIPAIRTQYPTGGHAIWGRVYNPNPTTTNSVFNDGKLTTIYQWLLQYSKQPVSSSTSTTSTTTQAPLQELGRIFVPRNNNFVVVFADGSTKVQ